MKERNTYYYFVSFISLAILFWAIADLIRILLENFYQQGNIIILSYPYGRPYYDYENYIKMITLRASIILITLPIFTFHWFKTSGDILRVRLEEYLSKDLSQRKTYSQLVLVLSGLILLFSGSWIIYGVLQNLLLETEIQLARLTTPIPYFFISFVICLYHWSVLEDQNRRLKKLADGEEFAFCSGCGKKLK